MKYHALPHLQLMPFAWEARTHISMCKTKIEFKNLSVVRKNCLDSFWG